MYRVNLLLEAFGSLFRAANTLKISSSLYEKIVSVFQLCYSKNGLFCICARGRRLEKSLSLLPRLAHRKLYHNQFTWRFHKQVFSLLFTRKNQRFITNL